MKIEPKPVLRYKVVRTPTGQRALQYVMPNATELRVVSLRRPSDPYMAKKFALGLKTPTSLGSKGMLWLLKTLEETRADMFKTGHHLTAIHEQRLLVRVVVIQGMLESRLLKLRTLNGVQNDIHQSTSCAGVPAHRHMPI